MPRCVVVFCENTGDAGLGMFSFPKDPELNLVWRHYMKRTKSAREPNKLWENTVHSKLSLWCAFRRVVFHCYIFSQFLQNLDIVTK